MSSRKGTRSSGRQASIDANATTDSVSNSSSAAIKGKPGCTKSASADNATARGGRLSEKRIKDPSGIILRLMIRYR